MCFGSGDRCVPKRILQYNFLEILLKLNPFYSHGFAQRTKEDCVLIGATSERSQCVDGCFYAGNVRIHVDKHESNLLSGTNLQRQVSYLGICIMQAACPKVGCFALTGGYKQD